MITSQACSIFNPLSTTLLAPPSITVSLEEIFWFCELGLGLTAEATHCITIAIQCVAEVKLF